MNKTEKVKRGLFAHSVGCGKRSSFCDGYGCPYIIDGETCDIEQLLNEVIRHEIIHAFLYASGLGDSWEHKDFGHDETVIDWFALQFKKIEVVINQLETAIREGDEQ